MTADPDAAAATIEAAAAHWDAMAAFAWTSAQTSGPGAVVMHRADLHQDTPAMHWFAAADVPAGDDFRTLMTRCDASTQVMVIVVDDHGDQAIVLEADASRRSPPECAENARSTEP
ncbi:MAG: hypothetical protein MK074_00915 [Phycisphaerales bacterium]|nr:hypothetical protein [Phycisphaerales bacterium]